jgi:predicted restriction endonuclease
VVVYGFQPERRERGINLCAIALWVHDRNLFSVEDRAREKGRLG